MRVVIHVRPGAAAAGVGGVFDGALVVAVTERAQRGRATEAALRALADALGLPRRCVGLVHGASGRRKVVALDVDDAGAGRIEARLDALRRG